MAALRGTFIRGGLPKQPYDVKPSISTLGGSPCTSAPIALLAVDIWLGGMKEAVKFVSIGL